MGASDPLSRAICMSGYLLHGRFLDLRQAWRLFAFHDMAVAVLSVRD